MFCLFFLKKKKNYTLRKAVFVQAGHDLADCLENDFGDLHLMRMRWLKLYRDKIECTSISCGTF